MTLLRGLSVNIWPLIIHLSISKLNKKTTAAIASAVYTGIYFAHSPTSARVVNAYNVPRVISGILEYSR